MSTTATQFKRGDVLKSRSLSMHYIFLSSDQHTSLVKVIPFRISWPLLTGSLNKIWETHIPGFFSLADDQYQLQQLFPWQHFNIDLYTEILERRAKQND